MKKKTKNFVLWALLTQLAGYLFCALMSGGFAPKRWDVGLQIFFGFWWCCTAIAYFVIIFDPTDFNKNQPNNHV
jgi:hypothetical protein